MPVLLQVITLPLLLYRQYWAPVRLVPDAVTVQGAQLALLRAAFARSGNGRLGEKQRVITVSRQLSVILIQ